MRASPALLLVTALSIFTVAANAAPPAAHSRGHGHPASEPLLTRNAMPGFIRPEFSTSQECRIFADRIEIDDRVGVIHTSRVISAGVDVEALAALVADAAAGPTTTRPAPTDIPFTSYTAQGQSGPVVLNQYTGGSFVTRTAPGADALRFMMDRLCEGASSN